MSDDINVKKTAFLNDLVEVCRKHGFVLGHEDTGGNFIVSPVETVDVPRYEAWLLDAQYDESPWYLGKKK